MDGGSAAPAAAPATAPAANTAPAATAPASQATSGVEGFMMVFGAYTAVGILEFKGFRVRRLKDGGSGFRVVSRSFVLT